MKFKDFINKLIFLVSVPKCVGCKERLQYPSSPLCPECMKEYENALYQNCSLCANPLNRCTCSNKYLEAHSVKTLVKVYRYMIGDELPSNNLIYALKRDNRRDVVDFLAKELSNAILNSYKETDKFIFTNVPRRSEAIRKYGIDHAAMLAKSVSEICGGKYIPLLKSKAKRAQKKLLSNERAENARFDYKTGLPDVKGKTVILIDDIVTTGASMGACAMLIKGLEAKKIIGAAISIAYKDKYINFEEKDRFKKGILK